jgi:hypothetical protein
MNTDRNEDTDRRDDNAAARLVRRVEELIAEGNARSLRILSRRGKVLLEIPLTAGAVSGGVIVLAAPWLAVIGAIAGAVANVRIEIIRETNAGDDASQPSPPDAGPRQTPPE